LRYYYTPIGMAQISDIEVSDNTICEWQWGKIRTHSLLVTLLVLDNSKWHCHFGNSIVSFPYKAKHSLIIQSTKHYSRYSYKWFENFPVYTHEIPVNEHFFTSNYDCQKLEAEKQQ
jgi:hypothetical protein